MPSTRRVAGSGTTSAEDVNDAVNIMCMDYGAGTADMGKAAIDAGEALVAQLCQGTVGAVFSLEASRLARNGRDWHHMLELCGLVRARVIDLDGVYDPGVPNDRLLLGLKDDSRYERSPRVTESTLSDLARPDSSRFRPCH